MAEGCGEILSMGPKPMGTPAPEVLPSGRSSVLDGVRTTGSELRCFPPRRKPVELVSTSDIMPGSSSNNMAEEGGG